MAETLVACWMFVRRHWPHVVALLVMAFVFTALHELAHAAAVWAQGGQVVRFSIVPTGGEYGHVRYVFTQDQTPNQTVIALAPYAMWAGCMVLAAIAAATARGEGRPFWAASSTFVWLYAAPFGDIVNTWAGWLHGDANDWVVLGQPGGGATDWALLAGVCVMVTFGGYFVQRGLYDRQTRLNASAYGLLAIVIGSLLVAAVALRPDVWVVGK